ncbi:MAG: DUF6318 family protein [Frankiaceae bacterium]|nr:DUF6318 family protein [Frankiaceae bacterium]
MTPSPSGWANTSPGEQAPARPADAFSAAGAAAFAVFSEQAWDWAMATGDTSLVRAVSDPDCSDCSDFADLVEQDVADGMRYVGGRVVLRGPATLDSPLSVAGTAVTVPISAGEWSVYDAAGNPYGDPQPAREVDDQRTLVWRSDRWWVAG